MKIAMQDRNHLEIPMDHRQQPAGEQRLRLRAQADHHTWPQFPDQAEQAARNQGRQRVRRSLLRRALLLGIAIGLSGIFFGIVASIILYGGLL